MIVVMKNMVFLNVVVVLISLQIIPKCLIIIIQIYNFKQQFTYIDCSFKDILIVLYFLPIIILKYLFLKYIGDCSLYPISNLIICVELNFAKS